MRKCKIQDGFLDISPLSANPTKCPNTLTIADSCLSAFDHFVGFALKGLGVKKSSRNILSIHSFMREI